MGNKPLNKEMSSIFRRLLGPTLCLLLVATGCNGKAAPERVTMVLFEINASTNAEALKQQYLKDFAKVLDAVSDGGTLAGDIIDDNPLAHSSFPINATFARYAPLKENKLDFDRRLKEKRDAVLKSAEVIVRKRRSNRPGTNVMEALQLAERVFAEYEGEQRLLVIFSDMIEQSRRYNFSAERLTEARIGQIIAKERSAGRLPDLQGVEVCVVGAGATQSGGLSAEKLIAIRDFWLQYFEATGAKLPKKRYGSALLKCP